MGGFAKYPWPQFLSNAPFYYNKHYKRAMGIAAFGAFVNALWVYRWGVAHSVSIHL